MRMATKKRHEIRYNYWEHMDDSTESRGKRIPFFRPSPLLHAEFLERAAQDALAQGDMLTAESLTVQSRIARALGEKQQAKDAVARVEEVALRLHNGKLL